MAALLCSHRRKERPVLRAPESHRRGYRRTGDPSHEMADSRRTGGKRRVPCCIEIRTATAHISRHGDFSQTPPAPREPAVA